MYKLIALTHRSFIIESGIRSREEAEYAMAEAIIKGDNRTLVIIEDNLPPKEGSKVYDNIQKSTGTIQRC